MVGRKRRSGNEVERRREKRALILEFLFDVLAHGVGGVDHVSLGSVVVFEMLVGGNLRLQGFESVKNFGVLSVDAFDVSFPVSAIERDRSGARRQGERTSHGPGYVLNHLQIVEGVYRAHLLLVNEVFAVRRQRLARLRRSAVHDRPRSADRLFVNVLSLLLHAVRDQSVAVGHVGALLRDVHG